MLASVRAFAIRLFKNPKARAARRARREARRNFYRRYLVHPIRRIQYRRMPVAMITGTKGKTTTTLMLDHIMNAAGYVVGTAMTDGVMINGEAVLRRDGAGYPTHRRALSDPAINAAVLETPRAMVLNGFYLDRCDVAALLNVGREQIGIDGIDTIEDMAALKRKVIDLARRAVVLNANDPLCRKMIGDYRVGRTTLFSMEADNPAISSHLSRGGQAIVLDESGEPRIVRRHRDQAETIIAIADLPSAWGGIIRANIANAMAAAALADRLRIPAQVITRSLRTFETTTEQLPGRFNVIEGYPFFLVLDHAMNPPAAEVLAESLAGIDVRGRRYCVMTSVGNRPDWHYRELAAALTPCFDYFICYEQEKYWRGREPGEISALLKAELIGAGVRAGSIEESPDYESALLALAGKIKAGDLAAVLGGPERSEIPLVREAFAIHAQARRQGRKSRATVAMMEDR